MPRFANPQNKLIKQIIIHIHKIFQSIIIEHFLDIEQKFILKSSHAKSVLSFVSDIAFLSNVIAAEFPEFTHLYFYGRAAIFMIFGVPRVKSWVSVPACHSYFRLNISRNDNRNTYIRLHPHQPRDSFSRCTDFTF